MSDQAKVPLFRLSTKARSSGNGNGRKSHLISTADAAPGEVKPDRNANETAKAVLWDGRDYDLFIVGHASPPFESFFL